MAAHLLKSDEVGAVDTPAHVLLEELRPLSGIGGRASAIVRARWRSVFRNRKRERRGTGNTANEFRRVRGEHLLRERLDPRRLRAPFAGELAVAMKRELVRKDPDVDADVHN